MVAVFSSRTCCGVIPIKTGVFIITIFGILNKICAPFGLFMFQYITVDALLVYLYTLGAMGAFIAGLYGYKKENYRLIQWYTIFYWVDCLVSTATTVMFAVKWFAFTDHSLPSNASDSLTQEDYDAMFRMEGIVSISILGILRIIHVS
ncbi:hypothetical protein CLU79DRAFT_763463 [Phycomyces nitens]|nr:hypothetical protein CLU79DRAFT_763463 [Phycomyces nitens]